MAFSPIFGEQKQSQNNWLKTLAKIRFQSASYRKKPQQRQLYHCKTPSDADSEKKTEEISE